MLAPSPSCGTSLCIDPIFGPTAVATSYWSSTTVIDSTFPVNAWLVHFVGGSVGVEDKTLSYYVRAVRGGP